MTATMGAAVPAGHTSKRLVLSPEALADHLEFMNRMFSKAVRAEMVETQKFLASLKRLGT